MGFTRKSYEKRSDKETQSPMLKIFKDIMQKEKHDPETTTLLKDKHVESKRKHYSGFKSKTGHRTMASSSSERLNSDRYHIEQGEKISDFDRMRSQPFQGEKRESRWFWSEPQIEKSKGEDTCSCGSCALKKLVSSDRACMVCLIVLIIISVIVTIMLVYSSMPCSSSKPRDVTTTEQTDMPRMDFDRLKRKVNGLGEWNFRDRRSQDPAFGDFRFQDLSDLDEPQNDLSRIFDGDKIINIQNSDRLKSFYQKLLETDAAIRKMRKNSYGDIARFNHGNNIDINNIVDLDNNDDLNNNFELDLHNNFDLNNKIGQTFFANRLKRSAKLYHPMKLFHHKRREHTTKPRTEKGKVAYHTIINTSSTKKPNNLARNKRYDDSNKDKNTDGIIIEKNKVIIEYQPSRSRIVAKCSHAPKDSKSYETQLKHPFYKNTQKFDDILGQFLDKKTLDFDKTIFNRFENMLLENNQIKSIANEERDKVTIKSDGQKTAQNDQNENDEKDENEFKTELIVVEPNKEDRRETNIEAENITEQNNAFENEFFDDSEGEDNKKERSAEPAYDILLSVSTIISPTLRTSIYPGSEIIGRGSNLRKLMQADVKEEDGAEYEDLKELLDDHKEEQDDNEENDRKKRDEEQYVTAEADLKRSSVDVHNPNWKGLMLLYPEELSQMMKLEKVKSPLQNKDATTEIDYAGPELKNVEYIEDYLDTGFDDLMPLAQAYSDYGVLAPKKENRKSSEKSEHKKERAAKRAKLAVPVKFKDGFWHIGHKSNFFERLKKGTAVNSPKSEGLRIEVRPTSIQRDDKLKSSGLMSMLYGHLKISTRKPQNNFEMFTTPSIAQNSQMSTVMNPYTEIDKIKTQKTFETLGNTLVFPINKKRTLKSVTFEDDPDEFSEDLSEFGIYGKNSVSMVKREANSGIESTLKEMNFTHETKTPIDDNIGVISLVKKAVSGKTINETLAEKNRKFNQNNNNVTLSDFFKLLSNWFNALDGVHVTSNKRIVARSMERNGSGVVEKQSDESRITEMSTPLYNSEVVVNAGYKSRSLLSINDDIINDGNNTNKADDISKSEDESLEEQNVDVSSTEPMKNLNTTALYETKQSLSIEKIKNNSKTRIVKRQAIDDSNLIFWNDLYDDEYGINDDPLENTIRDKHSADSNKFFKKPNTWLQDKIQMFSNKLKTTNLKKVGRGPREATIKLINAKRFPRGADYDQSGDNRKVDFAALTANMKEVCKRTAQAIQQSKNVQVRAERDESNIASSLMQQLVRLMTDLVDFQVEERTCRRLPPELQKFLEWLTSAKQQDPYDFESENKDGEIIGKKIDKQTDQDIMQQQSDKEDPDANTYCLGTLNAVHDLIQQYEDMSDDDKSLMSGVKSYLENQRTYLERRLSTNDESNKLSNRDDTRYKRDAVMNTAHSIGDKVEVTAQAIAKQYKNLKCRCHKYIKKIQHESKNVTSVPAILKHTMAKITNKIKKATAKCKQNNHNSKDKSKDKMCKEKHKDSHELKDKHHRDAHLIDIPCSESSRIQSKEHFHLKAKDHVRNIDERNIKDVYYKAIEEAKTSTIQSGARRVSGAYD